MSYTKYRTSLNPDTATDAQLTENNDRLIEYLDGVGEDEAAVQVDQLRQRANAAKEAVAKAEDNTIFRQKVLQINTEIRDALIKIKENQIDEQDTTIHAANKQVGEEGPTSAKSKSKKDGKDGAAAAGKGGDDGSALGGVIAGAAGAGLASKAMRLAKSPAFIATAAVGASAMYIGSEVNKRQTQSEMAGTQAERTEAKAAQGAGLAGAAVGAVAGAKAMGATGALIGTIGFPGVGTIIGGTAGVVTGGAAGAALGYYMGDKVGAYIADMWSGPLERLPDEQRSNPFTLHEYLTKGLIPELNKTIPMEKDPKKIEDIKKGVTEYTNIAKELLGPQKIDEWMKDKLSKNGLGNADYKIKRKYLNTAIEQFKDTPYYDLAAARINMVAPEPKAGAKGLANGAQPAQNKAVAAQQEKALAEAQDIEKFNSGNTLGKQGSSLTLSRDGKENFDILVRNGIISDDWGKNTLKPGGAEKLKQMPVAVLEGVLKDGYMDDPSKKIIQDIIAQKKQASESGQANASPAQMTTGDKPIAANKVNNTQTGAGGEGAVKGQKSLYDPKTSSTSLPYKMAGTANVVSGDDEIKAMIKRHEGVKNKPYKDSLGLWTVGVGHLIGDGKTLPPDMNRTFSDEEVNAMFEEDYAAHKKYAQQIPGWSELNSTGQGALTDLTFNMGGKWYKRWPSFTNNIAQGNTEGAAAALENSKWYGQVGKRAPEVVAMVRAGGKDSKTAGTKGTTSTIADATKQKGSGVAQDPKAQVQEKAVVKGTELASNEPNVKKEQTASADANKAPKESKVAVQSQSLAANTKQYDTGVKQAGASGNININNSNSVQQAPAPQEKQPRLLSVFS